MTTKRTLYVVLLLLIIINGYSQELTIFNPTPFPSNNRSSQGLENQDLLHIILDSSTIIIGGMEGALPPAQFNPSDSLIYTRYNTPLKVINRDSLLYTTNSNYFFPGDSLTPLLDRTEPSLYTGKPTPTQFSIFEYLTYALDPQLTKEDSEIPPLLIIENYPSDILKKSISKHLSERGFTTIYHMRSVMDSKKVDMRRPLLHLIYILQSNIHRNQNKVPFSASQYTLLVSYNKDGFLDYIAVTINGVWHTMLSYTLKHFSLPHYYCPEGCTFEIDYYENNTQ